MKQGKTRLYAGYVLTISILWGGIGLFDGLNSIVYTGHFNELIQGDWDQVQYAILKALTAFFSSIAGVGLLIFRIRPVTRKLPFGLAITVNTLFLTGIALVIQYWVINQWFPLENTELMSVRLTFFWFLVSASTLFFVNVIEKYGPGTLGKMLKGYYHQPFETERIFMFMDIKSSTSIAEDLGHIKFFELLDDFFLDVTDPIIETKGEIYQYVGDEVVISWSMKNGLYRNNCLRCYYLAKNKIANRSDYYMKKYGLIPHFKVGLHYGQVYTGAIGRIKRDIVYSGDVLNTTARLESICNKFRVSILMSKRLVDKLKNHDANLPARRVGIIELKGKTERVELFTL